VSHTEKTTTQSLPNGEKEVVGTSSETAVGATIYGPITANGSRSTETETEGGHSTTTNTTKAYLGVGGTFGGFFVLDFSIQVGVKYQTKKEN
jgi:hypothetical protein